MPRARDGRIDRAMSRCLLSDDCMTSGPPRARLAETLSAAYWLVMRSFSTLPGNPSRAAARNRISGVQTVVEVVVVGLEVEEAVARVVEQDDPGLALLLGGQGLVDDG